MDSGRVTVTTQAGAATMQSILVARTSRRHAIVRNVSDEPNVDVYLSKADGAADPGSAGVFLKLPQGEESYPIDYTGELFAFADGGNGKILVHAPF